MAIDINNTDISKLTLQDLVNDAVDRNDMEALKWLQDESSKEIECKGENGTIMKCQPVYKYRRRYLEQFCGYKKEKPAKMTAKQKSDQKRKAMFDAAFAQLK